MEAKGLTANVSKTKVMFGGKRNKAAVEHVKYPYGFCSKGVGSNSILCIACGKWAQKRFSGITERLGKIYDFECNIRKASTKQDDLDLHIGIDIEFLKE